MEWKFEVALHGFLCDSTALLLTVCYYMWLNIFVFLIQLVKKMQVRQECGIFAPIYKESQPFSWVYS